MTRTRYH